MTRTELLYKLKAHVSNAEMQALMDTESRLTIGKYNRKSVLEMMNMGNAGDESIDEEKVLGLKHCLQTYLDQYMEQREGHKWIILASIYHACILEIPIHPVEVTKIKVVRGEGQTEYYCPCKETEKGTVCDYCVCKKYEYVSGRI